VNINEDLAAGTYTATVNYTQGNSYTIKASGDTGNALSNATDFGDYLTYINDKIDSVSTQLAKIGAMNGRLSFKEDQVSAAQINVEGAYNRIMNANMAEEQVNASKFQILQQTSAAMLAQANAAPQFLLSLFR
jgi:flagellin